MTNIRANPSSSGGSLSTVGAGIGRSDSTLSEPPEPPTHSRRSSTHSIRNSLMLPMLPSMSDTATKSSTASMSTITRQNTVPVAHFTLPRAKPSGPSPEDRPESSGSLASTNLMHNLRRSSTSHTSNLSTDSGNSGRWSVFSGFWRRRSSGTEKDIHQTTDDGLGVSNVAFRGGERSSRSQLELMVQELSMDRELFEDCDAFDSSAPLTGPAMDDLPELYPITGSSGIPASEARPIPERPKQLDSTLKLSVNAKDGVIDVDIALPDFGSPLQSPLFGGYASSQPGSSYGEGSVLSMPHGDPDQPANVAGWLKQFHPDFAVQAIKPYADLERDIKRAMSAEPTPITSAATPTLEQGPLERWVDVCSALVADTRTFSIKRIRLRRLVKIIPTPTYNQSALTPGVSGVAGRSQYGNPYTMSSVGPLVTEVHLKEEFTEEPIMDFDATLIDAVDRVLSLSGQSSRVHSTTSSRSSSRRGRRDTRSGSDAGHQPDVSHTDCKGIIFDALESVVKDVAAERNGKDEPPKDISNSDNKKSGQNTPPRTSTDSTLREGIRRWLVEVE